MAINKLQCPNCMAIAVTTTAYGSRRDYCPNGCAFWSWGGARLVSRETHSARVKAHKIFDQLWSSGKMSRSEAYSALAFELNWSKTKTHFKTMSADECYLAMAAAVKIFERQ